MPKNILLLVGGFLASVPAFADGSVSFGQIDSRIQSFSQTACALPRTPSNPPPNCDCKADINKLADQIHKDLVSIVKDEAGGVLRASAEGDNVPANQDGATTAARNTASIGAGTQLTNQANLNDFAAITTQRCEETLGPIASKGCDVQAPKKACQLIAKDSKIAAAQKGSSGAELMQMAQVAQGLLGQLLTPKPNNDSSGSDSGSDYSSSGVTPISSSHSGNGSISGLGNSLPGATDPTKTTDTTAPAYTSSDSAYTGSNLASGLGNTSGVGAMPDDSTKNSGSSSSSLGSTGASTGALASAATPSAAGDGASSGAEYSGGTSGSSSGMSRKSSLGLTADSSAIDSITGKDKSKDRSPASVGGKAAATANKAVAGADNSLFKLVSEKIREYKNVKHLLL